MMLIALCCYCSCCGFLCGAAATDRCLTCPAAASCAYSAPRIYLEPLRLGAEFKGWRPNYLALVDAVVPDIENVTLALRDGPYGACVYAGNNDVCDQQVVSLQWASGQTASFSMVAFTSRTCTRQTRVFGSLGEIECDGATVSLRTFSAPGRSQVFEPLAELGGSLEPGRLRGHGAADYFLMRDFVAAVRSGDHSHIYTGPRNSLASHRLVFAAEESRRNGTVIDMQKWNADADAKANAATAAAAVAAKAAAKVQ